MARGISCSTLRYLAQLSRPRQRRHFSVSCVRKEALLPPQAPKPAIDLKHIRNHPELYERSCVQRNYNALAGHPARMVQLFEEWKNHEKDHRLLRQRANALEKAMAQARTDKGQASMDSSSSSREAAREIKESLQAVERNQSRISDEMHRLAMELPNLTSEHTPIGETPLVRGYINDDNPIKDKMLAADGISHVDIGKELDLLDFTAAATVSGWGWYYLKNQAALLEQALVQHALQVAIQHGFQPVAPPSMVYSHISSACGFQPRDQGGEQQVYSVRQDAEDAARGKPELSLAGTAEIPFAGLLAKMDVATSSLPLRIVGSSRCYRAEAGGRGMDTKGLYRVHEFTKVEMFAWTEAGADGEVFDTMLGVQSTILESLGLYCRITEQPSFDLGASAARKRDIEAYFPSRRQHRDAGWGEVTSTSLCTDYQTRRLATRCKRPDGSLVFPHTINGTALAVPRVLAALLETHWDPSARCVHVPEVLWPWMHGVKVIERKSASSVF